MLTAFSYDHVLRFAATGAPNTTSAVVQAALLLSPGTLSQLPPLAVASGGVIANQFAFKMALSTTAMPGVALSVSTVQLTVNQVRLIGSHFPCASVASI